MQLFRPSSKVQRDRKIIRESDEKLAKYSRRGLAFSLVAYSICLAFGYLRVMQPELAVVLTVGFFIIVIMRTFFLLRFDAIYAKGPRRWRNLYFATTLLGTAWWTVILISTTLTLGMVGETPILWIYTVIFQATVTSSLSPYKKFSHIYQFISIIPPALAALWMGGFDGYMYSFMMLIFYVLLHSQVENLHDNYWQRLEANFALTQRTKVLEAEKRNIDASVDLNAEFLDSLGHEFRTSLNDILAGLTLLGDSKLSQQQQDLLQLSEQAAETQLDLVNNIADFAKISNRSLVLENSIFNLRNRLEQWLVGQAAAAHQQSLELDYHLATDLPLRVNGDMKRVGQVFNNLLANAIKLNEHGRLTVNISFDRDADDMGYLNLVIIDEAQVIAGERQVVTHSVSKVAASSTNLWLSLCKGLVECLSGTFEVSVTENNERKIKASLPLEVTNRQAASVRSFPKLHRQRVLYYTDLEVNSYWIKEIEDWGLVIETVSSQEQAERRLDEAQANEHPFAVMLTSLSQLQDEATLAFLSGLNTSERFPELKQILFLQHTDTNNSDLMEFIEGNDQVGMVYRPVISGRFHEQLCYLLFEKPLPKCLDAENNHEMGRGKEVLLVDDHRVNQMVTQGMLKKLGYAVSLANNGYEALKVMAQRNIDIVFMDCQMPEMDGFDASKAIRKKEAEAGDGRHVPIVAMTAHTNDADKASCFAAGMDDYLPKPVRYDDIEGRLIRWLGR